LGTDGGIGKFLSREQVRRGIRATVTGERLKAFRELEAELGPILERLDKSGRRNRKADEKE
jgi:hypothetical protein